MGEMFIDKVIHGLLIVEAPHAMAGPWQAVHQHITQMAKKLEGVVIPLAVVLP